MNSRLQRELRLVFLIVACLSTSIVHAHRLDEWLQATLVHLEPDRLALDVRIAPGAALASGTIAEIDTDGDGRFSRAEQAAFAERIHRELAVSVDGQAWASALRVSSFPEPVEIREGTGDIVLQFAGAVTLDSGPHRLRIDDAGRRADAVYLVNALQPQASELQSLVQTRNADQSSYELDFAVSQAATSPVPGLPGTSESPEGRGTAWTFFLHGLRHILTGYDHLLFAAALVLAVRRLRQLLAVVTAFTLAHTLTSALAVFGIVHVAATIVEPAIAASIVVVALQNVFWPAQSRGWARYATTFGFGLFHGLGFAGGLTDVLQGMPASVLSLALLGFMLGVEAGQQVIVVPLYLLLGRIRRRNDKDASASIQRFEAVRRWASGAVAASGAWFLARALILAT